MIGNHFRPFTNFLVMRSLWSGYSKTPYSSGVIILVNIGVEINEIPFCKMLHYILQTRMKPLLALAYYGTCFYHLKHVLFVLC